jgi:hypothetical protein
MWLVWLCFNLRFERSLDDMLEERMRLNEEREILLGEIADNERAIKQATLGSEVRV